MNTAVAGIGVESVEYHRDVETIRTEFDQEETSASMAVIATLAEAMGSDPVELEPLYATVNPEALDAFVRVRPGTTGDSHVTFTHEDHAVTVHSYGVISIDLSGTESAERDDES